MNNNGAEQHFYILWNPTSNLPPRVRLPTIREAETVAKDMAKKFPGQNFYICKVLCVAQTVQVELRDLA